MDKQKTKEFISKHANDDVRLLALQADNFKDVDFRYALQQIEGRQKAKKKLYTWSATDGIQYPPSVSLEQCSSETTAIYKSKTLDRLCYLYGGKGSMADLTGGFGVDFSFMSHGFKSATYVEKNDELCRIAEQNFALLRLKHYQVVCADAEEYLHTMPHVTLIYLDPSRRDANGMRKYAIKDCLPNVIEIEDELLEKADVVMIKLSPMLDWHQVLKELKHVREVHIISSDNECKEMLVVLCSNGNSKDIRMECVDDNYEMGYEGDECDPRPYVIDITPHKYLYEPYACIMKAGCFALIEQYFHVNEVGPNSHLFVSLDKRKRNSLQTVQHYRLNYDE